MRFPISVGMDNGLWTEKFSDEPISGKVFGYWFLGEDNNKNKVYVGNLRNGIKSGKWTTWYYNGRKGSEITYKDGKLDGLWTWWFENGQKKGELTYKDGKKGLRTGWYKNGRKEREVHYKDGDYDVIRRWNEDGSVRKEPFWWE